MRLFTDTVPSQLGMLMGPRAHSGALNGVRTKKHVFHLLDLKDDGGIRSASWSPLAASGGC